MHWILLYAAIAFEVAGTTSLKLSHGLDRLGFFGLCLTSYAVSFSLLGLALKTIPVGVAYAIWSGFGTVLIVMVGMIWFAEAVSAARFLFIAMIVIGAVGLNLTTPQG
jgi:small multidrug resistance pump